MQRTSRRCLSPTTTNGVRKGHDTSRGKEQTNILQPIESAEYRFYRRQLDACVHSCTPSCFTIRGTDADVGNSAGFHTTTHCLLTVVTDLKDLNASGLQRTNKCCNRSVTCASNLQLLVVAGNACLTVSNTIR